MGQKYGKTTCLKARKIRATVKQKHLLINNYIFYKNPLLTGTVTDRF